MTKSDLIKLCLEFDGAYEDYPFDLDAEDPNAWTIMRHGAGGKWFACITVHKVRLMINLKCNPFEAGMLRQAFEDITPGYHMNKEHWNSVYPDGDVPHELIKDLIEKSYELTVPKGKKEVTKNE